MNLRLHANATTTPKTRALIQTSPLSPRELAEELGVSVSTVRRWRRRDFQQDASHTPHHLATTLTPAQEAVAVELRRTLELSLQQLQQPQQPGHPQSGLLPTPGCGDFLPRRPCLAGKLAP